MPDINLHTASKLMRAPVSRGLYAAEVAPGAVAPKVVDREGGKYGAGMIRGVSLITKGEALGHDRWIDDTMLAQVAEGVTATGGHGLKSRFAHPDVSGDGIGKMTAKVFEARVDGDRVYGDAHILQSSRQSPEGDLGGYVMSLAEEAPESFGTSIAFASDPEAERQFMELHSVEVEQFDRGGKPIKVKVFKSPDPSNVNNYPHARIAKLKAVDIVDEPAANPDGLFHRGPFELLEQADQVLEYTFGLVEEPPESVNLGGLDATRLRGFVQRFCQSRGITFSKGSTNMATGLQNTAAEQPAAVDTPLAAPATPAPAATPVPAVPVATPAAAPVALSVNADQIKADAIKAERERASNIQALCAQAQRHDLAAEFIASSMSVEQVQSRLFSALCEQQAKGHVPATPAAPKANGENAKYEAEFDADPTYAKSMTKAEYVAMRRIDDGLDQLKAGVVRDLSKDPS